MKNLATLLPYNICFLTLILGINICIFWQFLSEMGMGTCFISTVSLWNLNWKLIDHIYNVFIERDAKCTAWTTLSGVAAWQLSVVSNLWNIRTKFPAKSKTTEKSKLRKSSNCHALCSRRFGLSLGRPFGLWHCLEPYGSWNHCWHTPWRGGCFLRGCQVFAKTQPKNNKGKNSLIEGRVQISPVKSLSSLRAPCVFLAASWSLCSNVFFFFLRSLINPGLYRD